MLTSNEKKTIDTAIRAVLASIKARTSGDDEERDNAINALSDHLEGIENDPDLAI